MAAICRHLHLLVQNMAKTRKTKLEQDKMTDANLQRVIDLLEPKEGVKAITKKDACQILGMSYNTTRLQQVLDDYKARVLREKKQREAKRGKPADKGEIEFIITEYLRGSSIDEISKSLFRTAQFVKQILEFQAVPLRNASYNYFKPALIPDQATAEKFKVGEIVYSARYDSIAKVISEQHTEKYGYIYKIWLLAERWQQFAFQEAYELASLEHLRKQGVKV